MRRELDDADLELVSGGKELRAQAGVTLRDLSSASKSLESKAGKLADSLGIK